MKKNVSILLIVSCIFIIFTLILFAEEVKYDFRKTNWGMSQKQVKVTEDKEPEGEKDTESGWCLGYKTEIGGEDYYCAYYFLEDKLWSCAYAFAGEHTNKNMYIDDYKEIKETLTKKYGKPNNDILVTVNKDEIQWKDDLYKDDESEWGLAISVGHLEYVSAWETSTTKIFLRLAGDNYKIKLAIGYVSKELYKWASKILEEKAKNEF